MKTRFLLLFFFVLGLLNVQAQQDSTQKRKVYNPFEKYGYTKEILTLSKGRYQEFFLNDTLQRIGSVIYNIHTKQVVKILPPDTLRIDPEVPARWWGVDPLAEKFPEQSPYNYVENNPIIKIDPDGRESEEVNCCGFLKKLVKTAYKSVVSGKIDLSEVYSAIDDGITLLSPNSTLLQRAEAGFNLLSPVDTKEIKAVGKTLGMVGDAKDAAKTADKVQDASALAKNPFLKKAKDDLVKDKETFTQMIQDHKDKLEAFKKDPVGNSSQEWLKTATKDNPSKEELLKRAEGRIPALEKQIKKQEGELLKIIEALKEKK